MRTFEALSRRELLALVVVFGLTLLSLLTYQIIDRMTRMHRTDLERGLAAVDEATALLSDSLLGPYHNDAEAPAALVESEELRADLAPVAAIIDSRHLDREESILLESPGRLVREHGVASTLRALRGLHAVLVHRYADAQERRSDILTAHLSVFTLLVGAFIVLGVRTRRRYRHFLARSGRLLDEVAELLEFRRRRIQLEPVWEEERLLTDRVARISQTIQEDRQIAGEWMFGNLESFMPRLKATIERSMPCERVAVAFIDRDGQVVAESASVSLDQVLLEPGFREPLSRTTLAHVASTRKPRIIGDLEQHYQQVHQSEGSELVLREGIRSSLTAPIVIRNQTVGFLFVSSTERDAYSPTDAIRVERLLGLLGHNLYFHYLIQEVVAATTNAFVNLMERKDNETSLHITRMSRYSHVIARTLSGTCPEVTPAMLREILWFAPLHDIGKIGIPDAVLLKPGRLTSDERAVMEQHVEIGIGVVSRMEQELDKILDVELLKTALDIIGGHHERFDGTGYPQGLAGTEIPLAGRITALADVFDALTSRRPYKEPMSVEDALSIIAEGVGTHFDPEVHAAFMESLDEIEVIYDQYKEV